MSDAWAEHEERRLGRGMFDDDGSDDVDARACDHDEDIEDVPDEDPFDFDDGVTRTREDPAYPDDPEHMQIDGVWYVCKPIRDCTIDELMAAVDILTVLADSVGGN